jgi:hypothetical protein
MKVIKIDGYGDTNVLKIAEMAAPKIQLGK